jgi:hypothetical protein
MMLPDDVQHFLGMPVKIPGRKCIPECLFPTLNQIVVFDQEENAIMNKIGGLAVDAANARRAFIKNELPAASEATEDVMERSLDRVKSHPTVGLHCGCIILRYVFVISPPRSGIGPRFWARTERPASS